MKENVDVNKTNFSLIIPSLFILTTAKQPSNVAETTRWLTTVMTKRIKKKKLSARQSPYEDLSKLLNHVSRPVINLAKKLYGRNSGQYK